MDEAAINQLITNKILSSQNQMLGKLDELMSNKLTNFQKKIQENQRILSDAQVAKIEQINNDSYKFQKKGNEAQYKANAKVSQKLKEADSLLKDDPIISNVTAEVQEKIAQGLDLEKSILKNLETSSSDGTVSEDLKILAKDMTKHLVHSKSEGTVKKYFYAFKKWQQFALGKGLSSIPAQPIHVALYLTELISKGSSDNVVQSAVYGIKWAHKLRDIDDPTDNHYVSNLLETAKRHNSIPHKKKCIISSEQIIHLCELYEDTTDLLVLRDLAFIVLCFAGFLRFDEVSSLRCKDVIFQDSYISLFLEKSKTDQYRQGSDVVISRGNTAACPVTILKKYISAANISLSSDHFLFKPIFRSKNVCSLIYKNKPISYTRARETVISRLKKVCSQANIGLHSMRASGATRAASSSVNERCWKRHGRWRSDMSKDGYVEDSLEKRLEVTKQLGL